MQQAEPKPDPLPAEKKRGAPIRILLVTGLCILLGVLVVASVVFIRALLLLDAVPPAPEEAPGYSEEPLQEPEAPEVEEALTTVEPAGEELRPSDAAPIDREFPGAVQARQPPQSPPPQHQGTLVFVIDDAGNNLDELSPFLRFPGPLTIAVLPGLPYSVETARRIRAAGKEVFLHQPMEALGGQAPGPGAIYAGMSAETIRAVVEANLAEIGPVAGMNNHQGSKITMDPLAMETILSLCQERGIAFLDSRTIADTAAPAVAKRLGIPIGERDVFIDNIQEKSAMIQWVEEGLRKAARKGDAVLIGHTWSPELAATLEEVYPKLLAQGYALTTVSRLIQERAR
jgi:polysaccharide deacetylase 2 family uncharacterized protein YibQ